MSMSKRGRGKTSRAIRTVVWALAVAWMDQAMAVAVSTPGTMQSASAPSATMPTSGTCGFEINMILATGENLMNYQQAAGLSVGSSSGLFALGLLGGFTFNGSSGGTFSVTEVDRSYTSAGVHVSPVTVDSTQLNSGTFTLTPQVGSAVPGAMMMTLTMTGGGAGPVLLVMPVNGGNTLLIQDQTRGGGGGVCQF